MRAPTPLPRPASRGLSDFFGSPKFKDFASNALMDLGYGLTRGTDLNQGFQMATQRTAEMQPARDAYATSEAEKAQRLEQLNKTVEYLRSQANGATWADAIENGMIDPKDAFKGWYEESRGVAGKDAPSNVQEWEYFSKLTPEQQSQYLTMKRSVPFLDRGTEYARPDPLTGVVGPTVSKDNFTPAYDAAAGTATAKGDVETKVAFESLNSKLPGLKSVVSELGDLAEKATYTTAGKLWDDVVRETGNMPTDGALARTKYMSMVDNQVLPLLRDTFGAAFTVQEGESLRATLGAPDKSPDEKKAVLEAFIEQKVRDLEALERRLPGAKAPAATGGNTTSSGVSWKVK